MLFMPFGVKKQMNELTSYLPLRLARVLSGLPAGIEEGLTEIRLRLGGPFSVTAGGKNHCLNGEGKPCTPRKAILCTGDDISACLSLLTKGSLYGYGDTLCEGYIPFGNGCRAGICGEARVVEGKLRGFSAIYGINLRKSRFFHDYGIEAARYIVHGAPKGALIYSPPNRGKTTLLKSIAAILSEKYRVAIADERAELYVPQGAGLTDRLTGVKKSLALPMLCRSMSPQFIICDELAAEDESALTSAFGSGVCIIATAHGESAEGVRTRPFIGRLLETGAFPLLIGIGEGFNYTVEEWRK